MVLYVDGFLLAPWSLWRLSNTIVCSFSGSGGQSARPIIIINISYFGLEYHHSSHAANTSSPIFPTDIHRSDGIINTILTKDWNTIMILAKDWNINIILAINWNTNVILVKDWNTNMILAMNWNTNVMLVKDWNTNMILAISGRESKLHIVLVRAISLMGGSPRANENRINIHFVRYTSELRALFVFTHLYILNIPGGKILLSYWHKYLFCKKYTFVT